MNYLIKVRKEVSFWRGIVKAVRLKNMDELKEFMLILPDEFKVLSLTEIPIYDTLEDFREDLKTFERLDIENGKLSNKTWQSLVYVIYLI